MLDFRDQETEHQTGKMKRFWSFVKSLLKDNSGVAPLKDQGKMQADQVDKANILNRQCESVFTKETEDKETPVLQEILIQKCKISRSVKKVF